MWKCQLTTRADPTTKSASAGSRQHCSHSSSPIPEAPQIFLLAPSVDCTWEIHENLSLWQSFLKGTHLEVDQQKCQQQAPCLCCKGQMTASLSLAWQVPSSVPLSLAIRHIPWHHCIKERTGSKPLQECFILRSGLGRWHTYYEGQTNKVLLPLVVLRREGQIHPSPVPAQAWKWLRGWVPTGGAGIVSGGRHMREHMEREEKGSLSRERGCSTDGKEQEHPVWCKESLLWNNKNLRHASRGKGSAYNHLIRATMWTVKLKTNEAKPRKRWGGTLPKRVKITFHHEGSCRNWHTCSHPLQDGQHPLVLFHISTFITKYSGSCTYTGELPQAMEGRELIKAYTTAHSAEENQDSGKFKSFPKN